MKRLKILLQYEDISGFLIYVLFSSTLVILSILKPIFIILLVIYLAYLFKKNRLLFYYSLIAIVLILLSFLIYYIILDTLTIGNKIEGIIVSKDTKYFIIKERLHYVKVYYSKSDNLTIGKKITITGEEYVVNERNVENTFSYYKYKLSKRIFYEYALKSYKVDEKSFSIYSIKNYILIYIDNKFSSVSAVYIKRLILGISTFSDEIDNGIKDTGIIYLFAISGLHISLLSMMIKKFLRLLNMQEEIISIILILFLFLYLFIASSSSSINRAIFMTFIMEILSIFNKKMPKLDALSLSFVFNAIINPYAFYQMGTILTYLCTMVILLSKEKNNIKLTLNVIFFNIPILLYFNHKISIFIVIFCLIFGTIFTDLFIPLTYLVFIFFPIDFLYSYLCSFMNTLISLASDISIDLNFSIINIYFLVGIYIIFFLIYMKKAEEKKIIKYLLMLSFLFGFNYFSGIYSFAPTVKYIDVGQGDSILLRDGFNKILIDTGSSDNYHTTVEYLKSQNINSLTAVFISHTDSDHYGELEYINNALKVKNVYQNLDGVSFEYGRIKIECYSKIKSSSLNESSMVEYIKIFNYSFLFTGDIEEEGEKYIVSKGISNIDFLKVAHHGSSSSSTDLFINQMKPKYSIISCGLNNSYGHPTKEVLNRLTKINSKILRTDLSGTINLKVFPFLVYIYNYKVNGTIFHYLYF